MNTRLFNINDRIFYIPTQEKSVIQKLNNGNYNIKTDNNKIKNVTRNDFIYIYKNEDMSDISARVKARVDSQTPTSVPAVIKQALIPEPVIIKQVPAPIFETAVIKQVPTPIFETAVIKQVPTPIFETAVIKQVPTPIPETTVIKQKLEVKVSDDILKELVKHDTPNVLLELLNKDNKSVDNMNYHMSPEHKIQLIEDWVNKNKDKWYNTGITQQDIYVFCAEHTNTLTIEQIYSYLINNNLPVIIGFINTYLLKWFGDIVNINKINEFIRRYSYLNIAQNDIVTYCKYLNLYYSIVKNWIESLPYKAPTTYDISNFKEKNPIFINNDVIESILIDDFNIKVPRKIDGIKIIRKPKDKYNLSNRDVFIQKYYRYYIEMMALSNLGIPDLSFPAAIKSENFIKIVYNEGLAIKQIGGKSIECNNTQVLYNSLGSCWNNSIQSIYAFYLDSFDSILDKTGEELYNEAEASMLIYYLPVTFLQNKKILIEMLDSIIKRWKNKRNKTKDKTIYSEEDSEC
jgi:hypothetical protein